MTEDEEKVKVKLADYGIAGPNLTKLAKKFAGNEQQLESIHNDKILNAKSPVTNPAGLLATVLGSIDPWPVGVSPKQRCIDAYVELFGRPPDEIQLSLLPDHSAADRRIETFRALHADQQKAAERRRLHDEQKARERREQEREEALREAEEREKYTPEVCRAEIAMYESQLAEESEHWKRKHLEVMLRISRSRLERAETWAAISSSAVDVPA